MTHARRLVICSSFAVLAAAAAERLAADEGMWTLNRFPAEAVQRAHGFAPTAAWLEQAQRASVRLAGGCSGSFVSPAGLVMTNYHCITECVEALSAKDAGVQARERTPGGPLHPKGAEAEESLGRTPFRRPVATRCGGIGHACRLRAHETEKMRSIST